MSNQRWIPLESNPDVLNKYISALGAPEKWQFVDVCGLEDELLSMIPQPAYAVVLLFPYTDKVEKQPIGKVETELPASLYYMKQSIHNACGTVALVHAIANNADKIVFDEGKHFIKFLEATSQLSPEERATALEKDEKMGSAHLESAQEGQTLTPSESVSVNPHFVTFVHVNGGLYELDGRKEGPVKHGDTTQENLLKDTAKVVREFMNRDPDSLSFNVMAFIQET